MTDEARDSQQEPRQDSALQTPQPDQPHPPVSDELREDTAKDSPPVEADDPDGSAQQPRVEMNVNVDNPAAPAD